MFLSGQALYGSRRFHRVLSFSASVVRPMPTAITGQRIRNFHTSGSRAERPSAVCRAEEHTDVKDLARISGLKALRTRNKALKQDVNSDNDHTKRIILGQSSELPIRARFAPSPTGYLHLGSLRTALFNMLAAKATNGGAFILRVEDTDQNRLVVDAEDRLIQDLKWAGLSWDEGPDCGGPYGPYKQSERLDIYKGHVQTLIERGFAYRCFCSPEHLEAQRRKLHEAGRSTAYPGTCRSIEAADSASRAQTGQAHVVRLKGDAFGRPKFRDAIYGLFQKRDAEDDFVLLKTDGFPTYHLANVVDDHLMKITHVIRGEEWLISTPKHLALYEAFGWKPPIFAHLGLLVDADGSKLSKRNDSVNLSTYQAKAIFPMALLAWLANLGSSFKSGIGPPRTISDIANALTFKFTRGGIKLNPEKLDHFHGKYRDALLWNPAPALSNRETTLLSELIIEPLLRDIESATNGQSLTANLLPDTWRHGALTPVPALLSNPRTQTSYLFSIFSSKHGGFLPTQTLFQQHPYLLWRVPECVYMTSLAGFRPDQRILQALRDAIENENLWSSPSSSSAALSKDSAVMDAIWAALNGHDIANVAVHETLRLIGAGGRDVVSQSSSRMLSLLGREEWRARLDVVDRLLDNERTDSG